MKKIVPLFLLLFCFFGRAQSEFEEGITALKAQIKNSEGSQKLMLLDSLSRYITSQRSGYNFDSITRATIELAYELDSFAIGLASTDDLIFFHANRSGTPEEGIKIFEEFKARNHEESDKRMLAKLYTNAGDAYFFSGKLEASIPVYNEAEKYALMANDSSRYAIARTYKAGAYVDQGDYATGSQLLKETALLFTKLNDTVNILMSRGSLANIYGKIGFSNEAKKERDELIRLAELTKNYYSLIPNLYNASLGAKKDGDLELALQYLTTASDYSKGMENKIPANVVVDYALLTTHSQNKDLVKAKEFYELVKNKYGNLTTIPFEGEYLHSISEYYMAIGAYDKAQKAITKKLNIYLEAKNSQGIYEGYDSQAKVSEAKGDYKTALLYSKKYNAYQDSINGVKKALGVSYYQTLYETEKRDFKIQEQATEISLLDAKNRIKSQWMLFGGIGLVALFTIIYLFRSNKFARTKQELQEQFSQDLIKEQEQERTRLARELHDSVGQKLMLLTKQTKTIGNPNMENLADNTLAEIRSISRGLYPANLERLGLTESINALVYDINSNTDLFFTEEIENVDNLLSKDAELHLYRIIQESLNNVVKHSEAKAIEMKVNKVSDGISVLVKDNGKGFDFEKKYKNLSLGLKTLYERAKILGAKIDINSQLAKGTALRLTIPI
ncbi:tetratricopeptide repeat-containing sensor histidine kinase [Croceivirga thetidis]|uniref:histidine kinase n=1 Tax=Croceivirga thetidis TaxID=2721623 RepID=A0ABX1GQM3_9FLAO|nr:sensor histidine kinase [Croceivirga thetidis]NKI31953.1 sensor histidine kinase [Croceivirga thetidis]